MIQELVNDRTGCLCHGPPTIAEYRRSIVRLRAYLLLFRDRYGDDLDERDARLLEHATIAAENLAELAECLTGGEANRAEGGTAEIE